MAKMEIVTRGNFLETRFTFLKIFTCDVVLLIFISDSIPVQCPLISECRASAHEQRCEHFTGINELDVTSRLIV